MIDQAVFLFDNQYDPHTIDKIYHQVRETTWDHCIQIQEDMLRQTVWEGPITDFSINKSLNTKLGFPKNTYSLLIDEKFLTGHQRYLMTFFLKNKNTISLREILQDDKYQFAYMLHVGPYLYMEARIFIAREGTYLLIIPGDHELTESMWADILDSFGNATYTPNHWTLIKRPKVSYVYGLTTAYNSIYGGKLYLDQFIECKSYYVEKLNTQWKIGVSIDSDNLGLMTTGMGTFSQDDEGRYYIALSDAFTEYITSNMSQIYVYAWNEDRKLGYAISPNYIGPTGYLKTVFDEFLAAITSARLKVLASAPEGGWEVIDGTDGAFDTSSGLVAVGFDTSKRCWVAIPTKDGICPVHPHNFRIWEYDSDNEILGRMVATSTEATFPNIYYYTLESESNLLYIEWFRDDESVGTNYEDLTSKYRNYVGDSFTYQFLNGELVSTVQDFAPVHSVYDGADFVKNLLLYNYHEYRVEKMREILSDSGMHYSELFNALDKLNAPYTTNVYHLADLPDMYTKLMAMGDTAQIVLNTRINSDSYDIYLDGVRLTDSTCEEGENGFQYVTIPTANITSSSIIIIDAYESNDQVNSTVWVDADFPNSRIYDYPLDYLSGNDLVVCTTSGVRLDPMNIDYAINAKEYLIQVPESMIDWDELGTTIDDSAFIERVGYDSNGGTFKSIVFRLLLPDHDAYAILKSIEDEDLTFFTSTLRRLMVRYTNLMVTTEGYNEGLYGTSKFSKKVRTEDIALHIHASEMLIEYEEIRDNDTNTLTDTDSDILATNTSPIISSIDEDSYVGYVDIYNADVYRTSNIIDISSSLTATISSFYGADEPSRLLCFVNGVLQNDNMVSGTIPYYIGDDMDVTFVSYYASGAQAQIVYLPFPVDRYSFRADSNAQANLAGTGIMIITETDLVFENGKRIESSKIKHVTNQIVQVPTAGATYTIIRNRRDSNLFNFNDVRTQSFLDSLYAESTGFKYSQGVH